MTYWFHYLYVEKHSRQVHVKTSREVYERYRNECVCVCVRACPETAVQKSASYNITGHSDSYSSQKSNKKSTR